jgi:hypothetical protein
VFPFAKWKATIKIEFNKDNKVLDISFANRNKIEDRNPGYVMRKKPTKKLQGNMLFAVQKGEQLLLMFMRPPQLEQQHITSVKASTGSDPLEMTLHSSHDGGAELWKIEVPARDLDRIVSIETEWDFSPVLQDDECLLTLLQRYLDERVEGEEYPSPFPLSDEERCAFLKEDNRKYNFKDDRFQQWMRKNKLIWDPTTENEVNFAYRILITIHGTMLVSNVKYGTKLISCSIQLKINIEAVETEEWLKTLEKQ